MMATDLLLKPSCSCGSSSKSSELYGSNCKHMTLCLPCGQDMARNRKRCSQCGAIVTRLIREYNIVRAARDESYFIGKFPTGLPSFTKKRGKEESRKISRWSMSKNKEEDGKSKQPWLLDEVNGQCKYQSKLENMESGNYYLLIQEQGNNNMCAVPAGSWFNFNKVAQYKQLTLEEAEELMNKTTQKRHAWMMKSKKEKEKVSPGDDSTKGDGDDEDEEKARTVCGGSDDEDEEEKEGLKKDEDDEDEDGEVCDDDKGDEWEYEEAFTDDDETACVDKADIDEFEGEANGPELSEAIKQIEDDVSNEEEEARGLSAWGVELKELLKRRAEAEEDDEDEDDEEDMDEDIGLLLPKQKDIAPKNLEPLSKCPKQPFPSVNGKRNLHGDEAKTCDIAPKQLEPLSKCPKQTFPSVNGKRKLHGNEAKTCDVAPPKKMMKTENGLKSSTSVVKKPAATSMPGPPLACLARRPGLEEEIKAVLMQNSPMATKDFVDYFRPWIREEERKAFAAIVNKLSKQEEKNGIKYIVLKEK